MKSTTICALASSVGKGGIGVVRVSGEIAAAIGGKMLGELPQPRQAKYGWFVDKNGVKIDKGIALFFPSPNSFTGEDVLELQGHGGISVMNNLLSAALEFGAVAAEPGEFSKRAFLNGKMDLLQAEAVADIIDANSTQAARSALRSLSGEFSEQANALTKSIIDLRVFVEASIDFADEEIDILQADKVKIKLENICQEIAKILKSAEQGAILREGLNVVIAGKPNAGKSSLLNALTRQSSAIVTDIAGTTRDVLKETIHLNGLPLNIIDTAGLRPSDDVVEKAGIKRAYAEIEQADVVLLVFDASADEADFSLLSERADCKNLLLIKNKIDLTKEPATRQIIDGKVQFSISAKSADGLELLSAELAKIAGFDGSTQGVILARKRHIIALKNTLEAMKSAQAQWENGAVELAAQDLRDGGQSMGSITGEFSADDLLGEIFSSFCIGK
ncbi:MAG: tRNA uridine-5-carboxymethylaminomethyl(34) synthesis GTPase MnmE [Candidatus Thioglobus sp.]|nr:tRNA uridine-5-carboxymethylaminomethyl(34) synthesis GTPase MnmE [Candidatus Thioglobus sp.]